ncbi:MAG: ATP-binding protein, partial [Thermoleophilia bacterium]|nr:ATP-binding protein [Thermoleophilia bacterium]
ADAARIPATPDAALRARQWVCDRLGRAGWAPDALGDVALVVDEAVQNAVEHGSLPAAPVEVRVDADDREARVVIRDRGRPGAAPPLSDPRPTAPSSIRGRGRTIIAGLSEDAAWEARQGGTEVRVRFVAGGDSERA